MTSLSEVSEPWFGTQVVGYYLSTVSSPSFCNFRDTTT